MSLAAVRFRAVLAAAAALAVGVGLVLTPVAAAQLTVDPASPTTTTSSPGSLGPTIGPAPTDSTAPPSTGTAPPAIAPPGTAPTGIAPPAIAPPGTAPPGTAPPGTAPPAIAPPGTAPPGTAPTGTAPPAIAPPAIVPTDTAAAPPLEAPVEAPTPPPPTDVALPPELAVPAPVDPGPPLSTEEIMATLRDLAALDAATLLLTEDIDAAQLELNARRAELAAAVTAADEAAAGAVLRRAESEALREGVDGLVFASYSGARTFRLSAVLVSGSPQELLDRMTVLELLQRDSTEALGVAATGVTDAEQAEAAAQQAEAAAGVAEQAAVAAQTAVVEQRSTLQEQTAVATMLLSTLLAQDVTGMDPAVLVQLATSQEADARRASRSAASRLTFVVVPAEGRLTSGFGQRGDAQHRGIDIANAIGTPVVSAADGVVVDAGPAVGFGLWVRVQHYDGTVSVYGHVDRFLVRVGQRVSAGELIALMGNRGESTGSHLHFEVVPPGQSQVDPRAWFAERGLPV